MLTRSVRLKRARMGLRRKNRAAKFPSAGLIFGIMYTPTRDEAIRIAAAKQISRAGNGRAYTPGAPPSFPRTWDASQESLRNYACKDAQKGNCPRTAVSPPSVYLYGLSQAPLAMHRRRFSFPAPADYKTERKLLGKRGVERCLAHVTCRVKVCERTRQGVVYVCS